MRSERCPTRALVLAAIAVLAVCTPRLSHAQTKEYVEPYIELFLRGLDKDARDFKNPVFNAVGNSVFRVVFVPQGPQFVNYLLLSQVTAFPVPTSSGAFTYTFDPATRTFSRRASSFGPAYVERATTLGRRRSLSVGLTYQTLRFESIDGARLSGAPLYARYRYLDGRVANRTLSMSVRAETLSLFATFAATRNLDLQVVVPFSRLSYRGVLNVEDGTTRDTGTARSNGHGDTELRARWNAWRNDRAEAGALYGIRLPTGKDAVHSLERAQQKLTGLATVALGPTRVHINGGYIFRVAGHAPAESVSEANPMAGWFKAGSIANEATYGGAIEFAPHARLTASAEITGRYLFDTVRLALTTDDFSETTPERPVGFYLDSLTPVRANAHVALAATGAKFRLAGRSLLTYHLLVPLTSAGLKPGVSTVVGWELGF